MPDGPMIRPFPGGASFGSGLISWRSRRRQADGYTVSVPSTTVQEEVAQVSVGCRFADHRGMWPRIEARACWSSCRPSWLSSRWLSRWMAPASAASTLPASSVTVTGV